MASSEQVVVAVDQGTSSTKTVVAGSDGRVLATHSVPLTQSHPRPGWVEQSPVAILESVRTGIEWAVERFGDRIAALGFSTQRESAVAWDERTGEPLSAVLGWQDRRTLDAAKALVRHGDTVRELSGLPLDPMFSALKFARILDEIDPKRERAQRGYIKVGTVDAWLVRSLTGESRIEAGNASRTQLLDITTGRWSETLQHLFSVPEQALPRIAASDEPTAPVGGARGLPISAVLGDSHAALFGHGVRAPGSVKVTYGTGSSIMGLESAPHAATGVVRTVAWQLGSTISRAYEGNILATGATIAWLARILAVSPAQVFEEARIGRETVDLVPAFAGLGAPWWDEEAVALISGFDLGTDRASVARAAVESIPLQIEDVLVVAEEVGGQPIHTVLADGGPSSNNWLMQLQADLSQRVVQRSDVAELSGLGAAHLAGISAGVWSADEVEALPRPSTEFHPELSTDIASARRSRWLGSLARSRSRSSDFSSDAPVSVRNHEQQ